MHNLTEKDNLLPKFPQQFIAPYDTYRFNNTHKMRVWVRFAFSDVHPYPRSEETAIRILRAEATTELHRVLTAYEERLMGEACRDILTAHWALADYGDKEMTRLYDDAVAQDARREDAIRREEWLIEQQAIGGGY